MDANQRSRGVDAARSRKGESKEVQARRFQVIATCIPAIPAGYGELPALKRKALGVEYGLAIPLACRIGS